MSSTVATPSVGFLTYNAGFLADFSRDRLTGAMLLSLNTDSPWIKNGTESGSQRNVSCDPGTGCSFAPPADTALGRTYSTCVVTVTNGCPVMTCSDASGRSEQLVSVPQSPLSLPAAFSCPTMDPTLANTYSTAYSDSFMFVPDPPA
jgi:hypothetical protein